MLIPSILTICPSHRHHLELCTGKVHKPVYQMFDEECSYYGLVICVDREICLVNSIIIVNVFYPHMILNVDIFTKYNLRSLSNWIR